MSTAETRTKHDKLDLNHELRELVGDRTLDILERRSRNAVVHRRGWLVRRALLVADVVGVALAFLVAEQVFGRSGGHVSKNVEYLLFLATLPAWVVGAKLYGLYDNDEERTDHSTTDEIVTIFHYATVGTWLLFAVTWLGQIAIPAPNKLGTFWGCAIAFIGLGRTFVRALARRTTTYLQNTVIVGAGPVGQLVARKMLKHPEYGINLLGFVDDDDVAPGGTLAPYPVLASPHGITELATALDVERVVVAFPPRSDEDLLELVRELQALDVQVDVVPRLYELVGPGVSLHSVEGLPLIGLPPFRLSKSSALLKRTLDVAGSLFLLLLTAPVCAAAAIAIKLDSRGPVFFRQVRRGRDGELFRLYKFRTMVADADQRKDEFAHLNKHELDEDGDPRMFKIENDPRVTRAGRVLRRYLIDEVPQLLNVLKGDMSLVGPRPLILEEDRYVDSWARRRLELRPGMTGLWQVLGRQAISFDEMVKLDYLYVTTWSLGLDVRLLLRTLPLVFKGAGGGF